MNRGLGVYRGPFVDSSSTSYRGSGGISPAGPPPVAPPPVHQTPYRSVGSLLSGSDSVRAAVTGRLSGITCAPRRRVGPEIPLEVEGLSISGPAAAPPPQQYPPGPATVSVAGKTYDAHVASGEERLGGVVTRRQLVVLEGAPAATVAAVDLLRESLANHQLDRIQMNPIATALNMWLNVPHPSLCGLLRVFSSRAFAESAAAAGTYVEDDAEPLRVDVLAEYTCPSGLSSLRSVLLHPSTVISERDVWAVFSQLADALRVAHGVGLSLRCIDLNHVFFSQASGRALLSHGGLVDLVSLGVDPAAAAHFDAIALGRVLLCMCACLNEREQRGGARGTFLTSLLLRLEKEATPRDVNTYCASASNALNELVVSLIGGGGIAQAVSLAGVTSALLNEQQFRISRIAELESGLVNVASASRMVQMLIALGHSAGRHDMGTSRSRDTQAMLMSTLLHSAIFGRETVATAPSSSDGPHPKPPAPLVDLSDVLSTLSAVTNGCPDATVLPSSEKNDGTVLALSAAQAKDYLKTAWEALCLASGTKVLQSGDGMNLTSFAAPAAHHAMSMRPVSNAPFVPPGPSYMPGSYEHVDASQDNQDPEEMARFVAALSAPTRMASITATAGQSTASFTSPEVSNVPVPKAKAGLTPTAAPFVPQKISPPTSPPLAPNAPPFVPKKIGLAAGAAPFMPGSRVAEPGQAEPAVSELRSDVHESELQRFAAALLAPSPVAVVSDTIDASKPIPKIPTSPGLAPSAAPFVPRTSQPTSPAFTPDVAPFVPKKIGLAAGAAPFMPGSRVAEPGQAEPAVSEMRSDVHESELQRFAAALLAPSPVAVVSDTIDASKPIPKIPTSPGLAPSAAPFVPKKAGLAPGAAPFVPKKSLVDAAPFVPSGGAS